jgi:hypothetical protein
VAKITKVEAIRDAHAMAMERDESVVAFGADVGYFGGSFAIRRDSSSASARPGALIHRSPSPESSALPWAWLRTGFDPAWRSSSRTTCTPPTTRSSRRPFGSATDPPVISARP